MDLHTRNENEDYSDEDTSTLQDHRIRNVRCIKCNQWGHTYKDSECLMFKLTMREAKQALADADANMLQMINTLDVQKGIVNKIINLDEETDDKLIPVQIGEIDLSNDAHCDLTEDENNSTGANCINLDDKEDEWIYIPEYIDETEPDKKRKRNKNKSSVKVKTQKQKEKAEHNYKCCYCFKSFPLLVRLKVHERTHTEYIDETETVPDKKLKRNEKQSSVKVKTQKQKEKAEHNYKCCYCFKSFPLLARLKVHERTHTGEKPYICKYCTKAFSNASNFLIHERQHTGTRPYKCETCSKTFIQSTKLRSHQRTHTGEKPYKCNFCEKSFSQKSNLKNHQKVHTGERKFVCLTCNNAFGDGGTLRKHERIHTGEKPFKCVTCEKAFSAISNLKRHEKIHLNPKSRVKKEKKTLDLTVKTNLDNTYEISFIDPGNSGVNASVSQMYSGMSMK